MLYFFHHYELPLILRQVQMQNMLIRTTSGAASNSAGGTAAAAAEASDASAPGAGSDDVRQTERNGAFGSEADAQAELETIERDSDSPPPDTLTDDSEMESAPDGPDPAERPPRVPSSDRTSIPADSDASPGAIPSAS